MSPWASGDNLTSTKLNNTTGLFYNSLDRDYSLDSSGTADSAASLRALLSAATAGGSGLALLQPGTYLLGSVVTLTSGIRLWGTSGVTFKRAGSTTGAILRASGQSDIVIQNIALDGNAGSQSTSYPLLDLLGCGNVVVRDVTARNNYNKVSAGTDNKAAIWLDSCTSCLLDRVSLASIEQEGIVLSRSSDCVVSNCVADTVTWSAFGTQEDVNVAKGAHIIFRNNIARNCGTTCITINTPRCIVEGNVCAGSTAQHGINVGHSTKDASFTIVRGNLCRSNFSAGIFVQNSADVLVEGNTVEFNSWRGISASGGALRPVVNNNVVRGNGDRGIFLFQTTGAMACGNSVTSNTVHGIAGSDPVDYVISGNYVTNNGGTGITLDFSATTSPRHCIVTNNRCVGNSFGIRMTTSTASGNVIVGNQVSGNTISGFTGAGIDAASNASTANVI